MNNRTRGLTLLHLVMLIVVAFCLYGGYLNSPYVYDDFNFFDVRHPEYLQQGFRFVTRWLPYASFEWTRNWAGENMFWLRIGNLLLHAVNGCLLYYFLQSLFAANSKYEVKSADPTEFPLVWLAFFGALWFVIAPAAVHGVAYLLQRTILMATLFSLVTLILFLHGLEKNRQKWMWASAFTYLLATLSKEHAIMVPAVVLALIFLLRNPSKKLVIQLTPIFLLYGLIAVYIVSQVSSGNVIGKAYEPQAEQMLEGVDPHFFYPLSVMTQGHLFFQYLLLWLVPDPSLMAIDVRADFARQFLKFPELVGFVAFIAYGLCGIIVLLQRGRTGLLGFAMLCPWLLFATEVATVRIQEIFVIYRSYLWMPWLAAGLPFFFQKIPTRYWALPVVGLSLLLPLSLQRLNSFADPVILWTEALQRAQRSERPTGISRIYHNRGAVLLDVQRYPEAIQDFDNAIRLMPTKSDLYSNRAFAYLKTQQYAQALRDYDTTIRMSPSFPLAYVGRAKVYEALGDTFRARSDYARACMLKLQAAC
jgi:hypothetical protein